MPQKINFPDNYQGAKNILEYQSKIIAAVARNNQGTRRAPSAPRSLTSQSASLGAVVTWNAPVKIRGIIGFRIYKDTESNLLEEIRDPNRRQARITLAANAKTTIFVSAFSSQNAESPKIPIIVTSTGDQFNGGTNGSNPGPPPDWIHEPLGGGGRGGRIYIQ